MKILICEGSFSAGGAERVVCNLSNYLSANHTVKVVSLMNTPMAYDFNSCVDCQCIDKKSYKKNKSRFLNILNKITKNIGRLIKVNRIIKSFQPDIILSFLPEPSFIVLLLKKRNKIPTIISVRNDPKKEYESRIYYKLMKKLYPRADGVVFQTEDAKEYFNEIINCDTEIIPNPINPEFIIEPFQGIRKEIIVSVGRLQEQKNQKLLIEAFSKLPKKYDNYKLIIYGEGDLREELKNYIQLLNLSDRVFLPGVTKNIKEKLYDASLFVLSSAYEGMPNALMEAMTMGLPVISTNCPCGGPKFLIDNDNNGILVELNDTKALRDAMIRVLSDKKFANKLSRNASKIKDNLSPDKINLRWYNYIVKIYDSQKRERC